MHDDREWKRLKDAAGTDWDRALHRCCQPLTQIEFRPRKNSKEMQLGFGAEPIQDRIQLPNRLLQYIP
jgi:hypothetical protein